MDRVAGVLRLHPILHGGPGRPRRHVSDVLRGALVLAVGALDGLVLDAVLETIEPAARKGDCGPSVSKWIKDNPDRLLMSFASATPLEELTALCRDELSTISFQRSKMIEGVLWDVGKCPSPWATAANDLTSSKDRWTAARVTERLDEFVLRRHRIAHAGDIDPNRQSATPIRLDYVTEAERVIRAVGLGVSDVVDQRIRALRHP